MPLIACEFSGSRPAALKADRGTLELVLCPECSHIYNRAFEPERMRYTAGYENALGFSAHYREYLRETVDHLIRTYGLHRRSIVDIGCGSADFLSLICAQGANHGVGYDPSQQSHTTQAGDGTVSVVAETFSAAKQEAVDFVCAQQVLEHLWDLGGTLRDARAILKHDGAGYFEVPNGMATFGGHALWDLTYEHVSYFSPTSFKEALSRAGFVVSQLATSFGDQYLQAEVLTAEASGTVDLASPDDSASDAEELGRDFCDTLTGTLSEWRGRMARIAGCGRRTVLWGAGTKAVSFLNMLGIGADQIECVVDINPKKAGRFLPGTGQKVISPDELVEHRPDMILVMNLQYAAEIQATLVSIGLHCELMPVTTSA